MSKKFDGYSISRWIFDYLPNVGAKPIDFAVAFYISHLYNLNRSKGHLSLYSEEISQIIGVDTRTIYKSLERLKNASFISIISEAKNQYRTMQVEIKLGIPSEPKHLPTHLPMQKMQEQNEVPQQVPQQMPLQKMHRHSLYIGKEVNPKYYYDDIKGLTEKLLEQFAEDQMHLESYCMNAGISSEDYTLAREEFINHARLQGSTYAKYQEILRHFANYCRKLSEIKNKTISKKSLKSKQQEALDILAQKK